jgi:hypothetical protein
MSGIGENFLFMSSALEMCAYLFTVWSRVLLEKLVGSQLVKKYPHFMEPESSILHSQVPGIYRSSEADRSSPCPHFNFLKIQLNILLPSTYGSSKWSLLSGFHTKPCIHLYSSPYALNAPNVSFFSLGHPNNIG